MLIEFRGINDGLEFFYLRKEFNFHQITGYILNSVPMRKLSIRF